MSPELVRVRVLGLPVDVYRRAAEHSDELLREFALIREATGDHVPARLLAVMAELNERFGTFTEGPAAAVEDAVARGDSTIDIDYRVPSDAREAAIGLGELLDEADDFCRGGDLLTLATDAESLAFRRWFLEEFVLQIEGQPPRPWSAVIDGEAGRRVT